MTQLEIELMIRISPARVTTAFTLVVREKPVDPDTGMKLIGGYVVTREVVSKIVGPTAEYLGEELKGWTERRIHNVGRIFQKTEQKLGDRIEQPGSVHPKVLKEILDDGSFADDDLAAEYFGGVLASSRTGVPRDDRGAAFAKDVASLSTYQLRMHYHLHVGFRSVLKGRDLHSQRERTWRHLEMFIPLTTYLDFMEFSEVELGIVPQLLTHSMVGLENQGLIAAEWRTGLVEHLRRSWPQVPDSGILVTPSSRGVELFLWAHGLGGVAVQDFFAPTLALPMDENDPAMNGVRALVADENLHIGRSST